MILLLEQKMSTRKMWIVVFFKQTYKFSLKNGDEVTEDVDISVKGNFVQYHVQDDDTEVTAIDLSLIHIWRCRRSYACRSRWSPYH